MKKWTAVSLTLCLMLGMCAGVLAEETGSTVTIPAPTMVEDTIGIQKGTSLVVGSVTEMSGHFGTEAWGNNTSDMDVRSLLHGYQTVAWTRTLGLTFNGVVVSSVNTAAHEDGSRTYTIYLNENLTYNDGTPISAKDYVFSILLNGAPALTEIGGTHKGMSHIVGYEAYQRGETDKLDGVRLLSDYVFSLHITTDCALYFYGLAMLNVTPYPISVIAPGCDIVDDGEGVYIDDADAQDDFGAGMLQKTLLDPQTGYEFFPKVTSGPYMLENYDSGVNTATFVVNERYQGNYEGQKPHIERLELRHVRNETMVDELQSGEVGLLNKVSHISAIDDGLALSRQNTINKASYPRTGLSFLGFACEEGPTASTAVRRAIAMSLDRDAITEKATAGYAQRVYAYYGIGQWMATFDVAEDATTGQPALRMEDELQKLDVAYSTENAVALLESDGWTLNETGGAFNASTDEVRYRQGTNGLEALEIRFAKMEDSDVSDVLDEALTEAMQAIGAKLSVTELPFRELLEHYYRQEPRTYNLFYLASNFTYVFDPYYEFHTDDVYQGMANKTGLRDETLMALSLDMRETASSNLDGYARKWLAFQRRFADQMPMVPLYSNMYYDFYTPSLKGYDIPSHIGWGLAIPYAWME